MCQRCQQVLEYVKFIGKTIVGWENPALTAYRYSMETMKKCYWRRIASILPQTAVKTCLVLNLTKAPVAK